jgi:hypothetical protein
VELENTCRFVVEAYYISLGLYFPSMRLLHIIELKISISLKDVDYRVTPLKIYMQVLILVEDMHFDFEIKRVKLSLI